ncbi:hypothetical protein GCM10010121_080940 [Streptomyces brasiliensis]|uniref:Transposase IS110-like N-terminal domain-containing protein n=1 Tax=Streptomyces brasiliensis TaxID=1954 RepID=A0A917P2W1_9ACTN|nr:hypothetical protein GCM10010121_080940 [Streptomyces brasiliensis]
MAALSINILLNHGQRLVCIPGLAVNRAAAGYRGTGKTDAKDATVIADQARMRRDSGKVSGNLYRPRRYHRGLRCVFRTSALISIRNCDASRRFYERKRAEGKRPSRRSSPWPADE